MSQASNQMEYLSSQGNKYVFQRVKPSKWLQILDQSDSSGVRKLSIFYPAILENIVVVPNGLKVDDFEEDGRGGNAELDEVVIAASRFQRGKQ